MADHPTREQLSELLGEIHNEAIAGLTHGNPEVARKALDNIAAMARYQADVCAEDDKVRNLPL